MLFWGKFIPLCILWPNDFEDRFLLLSLNSLFSSAANISPTLLYSTLTRVYSENKNNFKKNCSVNIESLIFQLQLTVDIKMKQ